MKNNFSLCIVFFIFKLGFSQSNKLSNEDYEKQKRMEKAYLYDFTCTIKSLSTF